MDATDDRLKDRFPGRIYGWSGDSHSRELLFSPSLIEAEKAVFAEPRALVAVYVLHHIDELSVRVDENPVYFADWAKDKAEGEANAG